MPNTEPLLSSLTCGIAMCTCNGITYLRQQLDSLLAQEYLPDQIAIFDDASDDGTWEFLETWVTQQSIPVILRQNRPRLGVVKNFEAAVQALDTDLVFLCDQDDVWLPEKINTLRDLFVTNPSVTLVHTNARLVGADEDDWNVSLFEALGLTIEERLQVKTGDALHVLCRRNIVTGATTAFRRELLHLALPFSPNWVHDEWLAILASAQGSLMLEDRSTILYRQHGGNAIGMSAPGLMCTLSRLGAVIALPRHKFQLMRLQRVDDLLQRLAQHGIAPPNYALTLGAWRQFSEFRATLPRNFLHRMFIVLKSRLCGDQYQRFSRPGGVLRDIFDR